MGDQWLMGIIGIGLLLWLCFGLRHYVRTSEPLEDVLLSDRFPQDEEVIALIESSGYEIIGGKFFVPLHFCLDGENLEPTRIWGDMVVKRDEQWYIVRIARERMQLDWGASGLRKLWTPYFAAYPDCAGLLIVDLLERRVRLLRMDFGEAQS
ncbi:DNA-binding protein [Paenibacillus apiarius]|uniref:DNA-binding protein n=1 Tax=Paenibacillus apiarius TaxID=46240 RepID=UPI00197E085C|nr:DNA-binding protein [Paenibacillus apiarius]MBN3522313.1 DNA-binding protein [Paenibacillus apiarius]